MATHCDLISCRSYIKRQREYHGKRERNRINGIVEQKAFLKHIVSITHRYTRACINVLDKLLVK